MDRRGNVWTSECRARGEKSNYANVRMCVRIGEGKGMKEGDTRKRRGVHVDFSKFKTNYQTNVVRAQKRRWHYLVGAFADDGCEKGKKIKNSRHSVPPLGWRTREFARNDYSHTIRVHTDGTDGYVNTPTKSPVCCTYILIVFFFLHIVFAFFFRPTV